MLNYGQHNNGRRQRGKREITCKTSFSQSESILGKKTKWATVWPGCERRQRNGPWPSKPNKGKKAVVEEGEKKERGEIWPWTSLRCWDLWPKPTERQKEGEGKL